MEQIITMIMFSIIYIGAVIAYPLVIIPISLVVLYFALTSKEGNTEEFLRSEKEREKKIKYLYRDISIVDYKKYITSTEWCTKRLSRLKLDGYICQKCGTNQDLVVHHLTYKHLGNEPMEDLITLCRSCHQKIHDKYGKKGDYFPID